jgi:hypothetical protein
MSEDSEKDEALMAELRTFFAQVDPAPEQVSEFGKAALGWRHLDADLAELLSDSVLEEKTFELARGTGTGARSLTFTATELTIDVEIHQDDGQRTLLGQLSPPPAAATIEVERMDDELLSADTDQLGRFRVSFPAGGQIRLRVVDRDRGSRVVVVTSWVAV